MAETKKYLVDPPEGWRYGFPKEFVGDLKSTNLKEWCLAQGYPRHIAESYGDYFNVRVIHL